MPHFGLVNEEAIGPEEAALQRARLHIRGGKRRLRQGKIAYGVITLYDALSFAMQWYLQSPEKRRKIEIEKFQDLGDDKSLFSLLVRHGVLDGKFNYDEFDSLVEKSLELIKRGKEDEMSGYDYRDILHGIESVMTQLRVMPFDEDKLPKEDPMTF